MKDIEMHKNRSITEKTNGENNSNTKSENTINSKKNHNPTLLPLNLIFPGILIPCSTNPKQHDVKNQYIHQAQQNTIYLPFIPLNLNQRSVLTPIDKTKINAKFTPVTKNNNDETENTNEVNSSIKIEEPIVKNVDGKADDRKTCNCDRSHCLKLYCECFKSGQLCNNCSCKNCFNNSDFDKKRQVAIKSIITKNKDAFKPRVNMVAKSKLNHQHRNGCHCSKSGCLKRYCECFQNKVLCGENCRCVGCQNKGMNSKEYSQNNHNIDGRCLASNHLSAKIDHEKSAGFSCSNAVSRVINYNDPIEIDTSANIRHMKNIMEDKTQIHDNANYTLSDIAAVASEELAKMKSHNIRSKLKDNYNLLIEKISDVLVTADVEHKDEAEDDRIKYILKEFLWCIKSVNNVK